MSEAIEHFRKLLGDKYVRTDPSDLKEWGRDWTRVRDPDPLAVVLPKTTEELSAIAKYCYAHDVAMVPSGGRTGLAGGAVALGGEVVVSLHRMNQILEIDTVGMTIRAEAGVTTQALQEAAQDKGLFFAVDLAAKGSSHIGGNIATNAGGLRLIRYGGTREQVLGLEVVLPDGSILNCDTALRKNNTGLDLRQLFIGSEGTLGFITKATLSLVKKPRSTVISCLALPDFHAILKVFELCHQKGVTVNAFEFFTDKAMDMVLKYAHGVTNPFSERAPFYVLVEIEKSIKDSEVDELLEVIFEKGLAVDGVVASSDREAQQIWALRENITESLAAHGHVRKNDVAVAVKDLAHFYDRTKTLLDTTNDIDVIAFGHVGDGNLHVNYSAPKSLDVETFNAEAEKVEKQMFAILKEFHGSISAEHGIGYIKVPDLKFSRSEDELQWMQRIKDLFDPKRLMNPGKIFGPPARTAMD